MGAAAPPAGKREDRIDGEHRWRIAEEQFDVSEGLPFVNAGDISDAKAKALTISLNDLRGQFDTMDLAKVVSGIIEDLGMAEAEELLPYTGDRIESYAKIAAEELDAAMNAGVLAGGMAGATGGASDGRAESDSEFGSFDPSKASFAHVCPKCAFQFN